MHSARGSRKLARRLLSKRASKASRLGSGIDRLASDELHELRIEVKSLRYLAEFFSPLYKRHAGDVYIEHVAALQAVLGRLNDMAVSRRLVETVESNPHAQPRGPARRLFRRYAGLQESELRRRLSKAWKKLGKSSPFWD